MNHMPDIRDDPRLAGLDASDADHQEEESPLTQTEKRFEWLLDEWREALADNTYDGWRDIRMMCYGATQTLVYVSDRYEDSEVIRTIGSVAFEHSLRCLRENSEAA